MSDNQAGTETRRWTEYVCTHGHRFRVDASTTEGYPYVDCPACHTRTMKVVEVVEASDPEGTARDCPGCGASEGHPPAGPCRNHGTKRAKLIINRDSRTVASGGTRPAFTDAIRALEARSEEGGNLGWACSLAADYLSAVAGKGG